MGVMATFTLPSGVSDFQIMDVNGDSQGDLILKTANGVSVALSDTNAFGVAFRSSKSWSDDTAFASGGSFADINGDGLPDLVGGLDDKTVIGINQAEKSRIKHIITGGYVPENETAKYTGLHRSLEITYDKLTGDSPNYKRDGKRALARYVVAEHHSTNGNITTDRSRQASMSYIYRGYDIDARGRGLGFRSREATDDVTGVLTSNRYSQTFPTIGRQVSSWTGHSTYSGIRYNVTEYKHKADTVYMVGTSYRVYKGNQDQSSYSLKRVGSNYSGPLYKSVKTSSAIPDSCGNIGWVKKRTTGVGEG